MRYHASLDHDHHSLQRSGIRSRILIDDENVAKLACLDGSQVLALPACSRGMLCRSLDRFPRWEASHPYLRERGILG